MAKVVIFEEFMFSVYIISEEYLCKFILCAAAVVCVCVNRAFHLFSSFFPVSASLHQISMHQHINPNYQSQMNVLLHAYHVILSLSKEKNTKHNECTL